MPARINSPHGSNSIPSTQVSPNNSLVPPPPPLIRTQRLWPSLGASFSVAPLSRLHLPTPPPPAPPPRFNTVIGNIILEEHQQIRDLSDLQRQLEASLAATPDSDHHIKQILRIKVNAITTIRAAAVTKFLATNQARETLRIFDTIRRNP